MSPGSEESMLNPDEQIGTGTQVFTVMVLKPVEFYEFRAEGPD
jgi:hypothetical protein